MDKWALRPHVHDQKQIRYWGTLVGFCGIGPHQPVCFLAGKMDKLTVKEKADAIAFVQSQVGPVQVTPQTREAFDELESRPNTAS